MGSDKKKIVFTDIDLDGAVSYLYLSWVSGTQLPVITTRVNDFKNSFQGWLKWHDPSNYDQIYILDLDVSQDALELVDLPNVVIIDHHDTHVQNKHLYKNAKTFITEKTSCARHIYDLFKNKTTIADEQKFLVLLADDYDCYKLQLPQSHELNLLYWNYQGDKLAKFRNDFNDGFFGFTEDQQKTIKFYKRSIELVISELQLHSATIPINGKTYTCISTFASKHINDVADYILKQTGADIGFVVNLETHKVSLRRSKDTDIHLGNLAKSLLDGGGHEYAAGGLLNDKFMQFSELFSPYK